MPIIEVEHLTKEYRLGAITGIKDNLTNAFNWVRRKPRAQRERFLALDDVNFTIEEGEVVGIIGHNGAGKSTLLKVLAQVTKPTSGKVAVHGSVAPLIEVGAGINPELTGRENIYLNASILGIPKKVIRRKLDEIIEFSELEQFIDTPVKRYSSGMKVKLGFSIATSLDAEILIIDEVLAVGDLAFQRKCFDRMEEMISRQGKTVLIVSHNIRQIERLCSRAILLDHGKILIDGHKTTVCEQFYQQSNEKISAQLVAHQADSRHIRKTGEIELNSLALYDQYGEEITEIPMGSPVNIRCTFTAKRSVRKPEIIFGFHTTDFFYISSMGNGHISDRPDITAGMNIFECHIPYLPLMPGVYALRLGILDSTPRELFYGEMLSTFTVNANEVPKSHLPQLGIVHIQTEWHFGQENNTIKSFDASSRENSQCFG
ncbi:ABC transporter ATP-binding protein [Methylohalobius crimeensis]|uniref:ABC transporter ATP-binding protein n=1 Tax=Methylohalobius crimeensis TaxID=244365 RepID=UPI0003B5F8EB|nr:ABC transporter ATP-binding protein [Methylohalobius crimeensis]